MTGSLGFITALNKAGLTTLSGLYTDFAKTDQSQKLIDFLGSEKLTLLAPDNDSFDPENPSIGADPYTVFSYNTILGSLNSLKRAPQSTHDVVNTHMSKPAVNKRTGWDHQVQVVDTVFGSSGQKRWANETILIRRTVGSATVLSKAQYKDLTILPIDAVLTLPTKVDDVLCKPLVSSAPNGFTKLGPALYETGLMDSVNTNYRVTLFAPIDDAFQGLGGISTDQLKSILENHVLLTSVVYSTQFSSKHTVTAASGKKLTFTVENGSTYVSCGQTKATVLRRDVITANGAVHVIDRVLTCD